MLMDKCSFHRLHHSEATGIATCMLESGSDPSFNILLAKRSDVTPATTKTLEN